MSERYDKRRQIDGLTCLGMLTPMQCHRITPQADLERMHTGAGIAACTLKGWCSKYGSPQDAGQGGRAVLDGRTLLCQGAQCSPGPHRLSGRGCHPSPQAHCRTAGTCRCQVCTDWRDVLFGEISSWAGCSRGLARRQIRSCTAAHAALEGLIRLSQPITLCRKGRAEALHCVIVHLPLGRLSTLMCCIQCSEARQTGSQPATGRAL